MMITPQDVQNVQRTFAIAAADPARLTADFYAQLFVLDPTLKPLFPSDLSEQGRKLAVMLVAVVNGLNDLNALVPVAQALAKRHVGYGVKSAHYDTVGAALIDTLKRTVGEQFDEAALQSWAATYGLLAGVMKDSAYPKEPA